MKYIILAVLSVSQIACGVLNFSIDRYIISSIQFFAGGFILALFIAALTQKELQQPKNK